MDIYSFSRQGEVPTRLTRVLQLQDEGFIWLDFTREEAAQWPGWVKRLCGVEINLEHFEDSLNPDHPSYYDGTEDYDMLVFQGLTPEIGGDYLIETRSAAFFLFDGLLVSVRSKENLSFDAVKRKFCEIKLRFPSTPFGLVHVILDLMVDRYMSVTDQLEKRLESISDDLVDPKNPFEDWQALLAYRKQAHTLELICGKNIDALDNFRRDMRSELSENQRIRLNDLREHIQRVETHADSLQRDIEVAVQLHFAAVAHQTNKVIQVLTVLSAIFFPLTLITGIYGMNFHNMPELEWHYGYFFALGLLFSIGGTLFFYFRRRNFF